MVREVTEDDTGLKVLHVPEDYDSSQNELEVVDIVAIHGIGAHPDDTWCKNISRDGEEKRYVNWLEEANMLPSVVPHARIMRYGYESQWFGDEQTSTVRLRASQIAEQLLQELVIERDTCQYRALIFISHCFGGLVVLKALRQALDNEHKWPGVFASTTSLLFFGTPFRGTEGMKQSDMLQAALGQYTTNVRSESLRILAPGDEFLQEIVNRFLETRSRPHPATIACFYETKSSNVGAIVGGVARQEFVVNESSGCLDHTASIETYPLARTHFDINKFGKPSEPSYRVVSRVIGKMVDAAPTIVLSRKQNVVSHGSNYDNAPVDTGHVGVSYSMAPRFANQITRTNEIHYAQDTLSSGQASADFLSCDGPQPIAFDADDDRRKKLLASLRFVEINARHSNIEDAHRRTCEWLLTTPEYQNWHNTRKIHQHNGFLWIKGKPGTGKSTIMKYAFEHAKATTLDSDSIIVSFFFNARGEYLERSTEGMYRSLLHQLLVKCPSLRTVLDTTSFPESDPKSNPEWTTKTTQILLQRVVRERRARGLIFFIDALDECNEDEVRDMVDFFDRLEETASFLICFSSRHYPNITLDRSVQLILENQNGHVQDMSSFLNDKLRAGHSGQVEAIKAEILERSSGIFLWVKLVVQVLNKEYDRGRLNALRRRLKELPSELEDLFVDILTRDNDNTEELVLCLQWLLYAERPLYDMECYFAILSGTDPKAINAWNREDITKEDIRRFILSSSKGLAEVTDSEPETVQFIHQSVTDFLLSDHGFSKIETKLGHNSPSLSHDRLKRCCSTYLTTVTANCSSPEKDKFPFLRYAVSSVFYHANQARRNGVSQHDFLEHFPLETWIRLFNPMACNAYSVSATMLYIFADRGYADLFSTELDRTTHIDVEGRNHGSLLTLASVKGCREIVEILLHHSASSTFHSGYYTSAIHGASIKGFEEIVKLLLSHNADADVNALHGPDGSAIQAASLEGHKNVVKLLLDRNADVNALGGYNRSALQAASAEGHIDIVKLLLSHNADVNAFGGHYGSAIQAASAGGFEDIVRLLLLRHADVNAPSGLYGSAIQAASARGFKNIVKLLLLNGADVNALGGLYRSALHAAIDNRKEHLVELLLSAGASPSATSEHHDGAGPLYLAAKKGEMITTRTLLQYGANVNVQGGVHGSALTVAAEQGHYQVVDLLLQNNANINAQMGPHGSALTVAAEQGHYQVVELLLQNDANVNAQMGPYGSALKLAAQRGHYQVVYLLLQNNADVSTMGESRHSALQGLASSRNLGAFDMVKKLLCYGTEVNTEGGRYGTALIAASYVGRSEVVELLLGYGAKVNTESGEYGTALIAASHKADLEVVELLLDHGAEVNIVSGKHGTALIAASYRGDLEIVVLLLGHGAEVNIEDGKHGTALTAASSRGHLEVVVLLLDHGAEVNAENGEYGTALIAASSRGHLEVVELLLNHGAEVDTESGSFGTALNAATLRRHEEVVRLLLQRGADPNVFLSLALLTAFKTGHSEIENLLYRYGASEDVPGFWEEELYKKWRTSPEYSWMEMSTPFIESPYEEDTQPVSPG